MTDKTSNLRATERPSKIDQVITLLSGERGASLDEIIAATGWQRHSARAALTGLRKKGHAVTRDKIDGVSRYSIRNAE